jgi:hypothetical protein
LWSILGGEADEQSFGCLQLVFVIDVHAFFFDEKR